MTQTYELCVRDARQVLHHQLDTTDFADQFDARPYRQFKNDGDRIWSNLLSGDWAWREAVSNLSTPDMLGRPSDYSDRIS